MQSHLSRSVSYRTIKLFFIGNGERGKTTLLRRLRSLPNEAIKNPERTTGIDIEEWLYPPKKTGTLGRSQHAKIPVQFLAWDFAGQVHVGTIQYQQLLYLLTSRSACTLAVLLDINIFVMYYIYGIFRSSLLYRVY